MMFVCIEMRLLQFSEVEVSAVICCFQAQDASFTGFQSEVLLTCNVLPSLLKKAAA